MFGRNVGYNNLINRAAAAGYTTIMQIQGKNIIFALITAAAAEINTTIELFNLDYCHVRTQGP